MSRLSPLLSIVLLGTLLAAEASAAPPEGCPAAADASAAAQLARATSFRQIAAVADRFDACVQAGDLGPALSQRIAARFARAWTPAMVAIRSSPRERAAAERLLVYIGETNSTADLAAIADQALRRCPPVEAALCRRLLEQVPGFDAFQPRT
jgi:hypothetical protein